MELKRIGYMIERVETWLIFMHSSLRCVEAILGQLKPGFSRVRAEK